MLNWWRRYRHVGVGEIEMAVSASACCLAGKVGLAFSADLHKNVKEVVGHNDGYFQLLS